jgi:uncharacterized repeat protein (TIGR01451 family)
MLTGVGLFAQPTLVETFNPTNVATGQTSVLSFTILNPSGAAISNVAFSDTFPGNLFVQNPNDLTGGCGAGVITAAPGASSVSLTGGTIAANGSCTFSIDVLVQHQSAGSVNYVNTTGNVTASSGAGNTATATLTANLAIVSVAKAFGPNTITQGSNSTLTFTLTSGSPVAFPQQSADVQFQDTLPAGVVVATPNGFNNVNCTGGAGLVFTAVAGSGSISVGNNPTNAASRDGSGINLAAAGQGGDTCTFRVNVTATTAGTKINTTSTPNEGVDLAFSNSGTPGTATLVVAAVVPPPIVPLPPSWVLLITALAMLWLGRRALRQRRV